MTTEQWDQWLQTVSSEELAGFEEKAHAWADRYAAASGDITAESCLHSFFGDNPHDWLDEAFDSISSNCKSRDTAGELLKRLYEEVMSELQLQ